MKGTASTTFFRYSDKKWLAMDARNKSPGSKLTGNPNGNIKTNASNAVPIDTNLNTGFN